MLIIIIACHVVVLTRAQLQQQLLLLLHSFKPTIPHDGTQLCHGTQIFLQAALLLLQERDKQAPEVGMLDPFIFKAGPLNKAAHLVNGVWKVKYAEIRRGMFSYYENNVEAATTSSSTATTADHATTDAATMTPIAATATSTTTAAANNTTTTGDPTLLL